MGVSARLSGEINTVWAARQNRVIPVHSRVLLTSQRCAKHAQPTGTTETGGISRLVDSFRFETHFQEEALLYDNANMQIMCRTIAPA